MNATRQIRLDRKTNETDITVSLNLDGSGVSNIATGIGFLDHLLDAFAKHSKIDLELSCSGDLDVDDHHTAEDCGIAVGKALDQALGDRTGIRRFGSAYAPLDESLARAVIDVSGRPFVDVNLDLVRERLGDLSCENISHLLSSLATNARISLHVDLIKGDNDHHRAEAAFKAVALAFGNAASLSGIDEVPSTKGVIEWGAA